jgi:methionine biosynthesis protein MetW
MNKAVANSPDDNARGMLATPVDALRYGGEVQADVDPWEASGMLRALVPDGARVLDIGCGTGAMALYVSRGRNVEIVGIEPDRDRAVLARERGFEVIDGLATREALADKGDFDVVMLADVLEHVPSPDQLLRIATEKLKPDGRVIASIPNVAHWTVRRDLLRGKFDYKDSGIMDATHLRWFTRHTVRTLFEHCGLELISMEATAGAWMPEYRALPWRMVPFRDAVVHRLGRYVPALFGCQHVVEARLRSAR